MHFLGDITQPLHDEAEAFGGNGINITWNGEIRRLHGAWDDQMVERDAGGSGSVIIAQYAELLTEKIQTGGFGDVRKWVECVDVTTPERCALRWATDANWWNCEFVLKSDVRGMELNGTYFEGARGIIKTQIAKGGLRLGYFLNELAAADAGTAQELKV